MPTIDELPAATTIAAADYIPITRNSTNVAYKATGDQVAVLTQTLPASRVYDQVGSSYGWRDMISDLQVKGSGVNNPTWATFRNGISAWTFSAGTMNEVWSAFHFQHDLAVGTEIYLHVHWAPSTTSTGVVRWGFEYTYADGHQQGSNSDFPATTTVYVNQTIGSNLQYRHHVAETTAISGSFEPDGLILVRIFRDAADGADTFPDTVCAFTADVHYQVDRYSTKNKAPNFYT